MTTTSRTERARGAAGGTSVIAKTAIAAAAATIGNLLLYVLAPLAGVALNIPLMGPGSPIVPLPWYMVVIATVVPTIFAGLLWAALNRFTRRPDAIFRIIAAVVLVISFAGPLTLPVALSTRLVLAAMHVLSAAIVAYVLTTRSRAA